MKIRYLYQKQELALANLEEQQQTYYGLAVQHITQQMQNMEATP